MLLVIIVAVGIVGYTLTTKWRGNDNRDYENTKYGYSLQYPENWNMRGSAQSDILQFFTSENPPGDGGVPAGILMEVMVLENYDSLGLDEWVNQLNERGPEVEIVSSNDIRIGGIRAIRQAVAVAPDFDLEGLPIGVYFAKDNNIFLMHYLGSEPDYTDNLGGFETVLSSFSFN